jgi:predicted dehydrogenase
MERVNLGIVGCGNISSAYLQNLKRFPFLEVAACADLDVAKARARAAEFAVERACATEELLKDAAISIVVNLTTPKAHYQVARAALEAGKSVYNEKPLAVERDEGRSLLKLAQSRRLRVGCAPDTFFGAGIQTCRKLLDDGALGRPVAASAFMVGGGHEAWHPDPEFFYQAGGGPMFDMGPYYLTTLVFLLGPVRSVAGMARISYPERIIGSGPKKGRKIKVVVPTHVAGLVEFAGGPIGTIITSFDAKGGAQLPRIEIYGSEGTLSVPDPNGFGGPVRLRRRGEKEWLEMPLTHANPEKARGLGVADMARAIRSRRPHRASGELAYHVLDVMHAFHDASDSRRQVTLKSTCEGPAPLPLGLKDWEIND